MIYLVAASLAWIAAQCLKHLARLAGRNQRIFMGNPRNTLLLSGGMPSAHSATVTALTLVIGFTDGFTSGLFALSFLFAAVIMYDAMMVRYSSGRQGDLLNRLLKEKKSGLEPVRVAHGHTVVEVAVGAILGVIVGCVVFFTLQ